MASPCPQTPVHVTVNRRQQGHRHKYFIWQFPADPEGSFLIPPPSCPLGRALAPHHRNRNAVHRRSQVRPPLQQSLAPTSHPGQRCQERHSVSYRVQELTPHVSGRRRRVPELVGTLCKRNTRLESSASPHSVLLSLRKEEAHWASLVNDT